MCEIWHEASPISLTGLLKFWDGAIPSGTAKLWPFFFIGRRMGDMRFANALVLNMRVDRHADMLLAILVIRITGVRSNKGAWQTHPTRTNERKDLMKKSQNSSLSAVRPFTRPY